MLVCFIWNDEEILLLAVSVSVLQDRWRFNFYLLEISNRLPAPLRFMKVWKLSFLHNYTFQRIKILLIWVGLFVIIWTHSLNAGNLGSNSWYRIVKHSLPLPCQSKYVDDNQNCQWGCLSLCVGCCGPDAIIVHLLWLTSVKCHSWKDSKVPPKISQRCVHGEPHPQSSLLFQWNN